jgi:thiamine-phosphate diphosphorylase
MKKPDYTLHFVTDETLSKGRSTISVVKEAILGGATVIQLRDKGRNDSYLLETGRIIKQLCDECNVLFIVNDSPSLAAKVGADGVHLGQSDMSVHDARAIIGYDAVIGISVLDTSQAMIAEQNGADYLGAGPIFATQSKDDADGAIGTESLAEIVHSVSIPVVAIGGIHIDNAGNIARTGSTGIAVISAISASENIKMATSLLKGRFLSAMTV